MRLSVVKDLYPEAGRLVRRLADQKVIDARACEGLSAYALQRINEGTTSERDATVLLMARTGMLRRQR